LPGPCLAAGVVLLVSVAVALWLIRAMEADMRERKRYDKEPWWLRAYEPDDLHDPLPDDAYITTPAHLVAQHSGDGES